MKKGIAIASALAVVAVSGAFVATRVNDNETIEETTIYTQEEQIDYNGNQNNSGDSDGESIVSDATTSTTADVNEADIKSFEEIFSEIRYFPCGTAGSSIKAVSIAADLINFSENTTNTDSELEEEAETLIRDMSEDKYNEFLDNLYEINDYVEGMYNGKDYHDLIDYTIQTSDGKFSIEKYQKIYKMLGGE